MNSLVQYDSSSDEEEDQRENKPVLKRKASTSNINQSVSKMPKLPSFFDKPESKQTSKYHQGRVRTVPHQHDSWATYVYCKVDLSHELKKFLPYLKEIEILPEQHISLSRPVYLRKHQLTPFKKAIKATFQNSTMFGVSFAQAAHLTNDEKTRSFFTLEIGHGYNQLYKYMANVDNVMKQYHKPTFYNPPRFHASIAWSLKESTIESIHIPPKIIEELANDVFNIDKMYIKMGNIIETITLE